MAGPHYLLHARGHGAKHPTGMMLDPVANN